MLQAAKVSQNKLERRQHLMEALKVGYSRSALQGLFCQSYMYLSTSSACFCRCLHLQFYIRPYVCRSVNFNPSFHSGILVHYS